MTLEVTVNEVLLKEDNLINEGEYNVKKINFEFSDEYTGLTKKCRFIMDEETTYEEDILDNQCEIPVEVNAYDGYIKIGVYAYNEVEGVLELRYSPSPLKYLIRSGSFKTDGEIIKPERLITIEQSIDSDSEANVPSVHAVKKALDSLSVSGFEAGENITFEENEETKKTIINATDTIYDDTEIKDELNNKVDKVEGKGLSTNDYIDEDKDKLASLENYDDREVKQSIADLETNKADKTEIPDTSTFITKDVNNLTNYELKDNVGNSINLSIDSDTYVMTLQLKNSNGDVISSGNVDLPLETMVVNASYDSDTKEIVLTLQNGNTTRFSVADLVSGLVSEDELSNYYTKIETDNTFLKNSRIEQTLSSGIPVLVKSEVNDNQVRYVKAQTEYFGTSNGNVIPIRDNNGNIHCTTPTENTHTVNKEYVDTQLATKQDTLTAGDNITITDDEETGNKVISATGGSVEDVVITATITSVARTFNQYYFTGINNDDIQKLRDYIDSYIDEDGYVIPSAPKILVKLTNTNFPPNSIRYANNYIYVTNIKKWENNWYVFEVIDTKLASDTSPYIAMGKFTYRYNEDVMYTNSYYDNNYMYYVTIPTYYQNAYVMSGNYSQYLSTINTYAYTPTDSYHPSTKKYVDDTVASAVQEATNEEIDAIFESEGE